MYVSYSSVGRIGEKFFAKNLHLYARRTKKYALIGQLTLTEKLKVLEIRQKNPKATGAVIIKVFYVETQRSITDSTLRRIIKNEKKYACIKGKVITPK
jgi:hypothetical protein